MIDGHLSRNRSRYENIFYHPQIGMIDYIINFKGKRRRYRIVFVKYISNAKRCLRCTYFILLLG